ncbi:integrase [Pseudomonas frederiksbergensis]|uniref:DDE-type integrase/transposase/recombinase n=1 Tax=Pseudomonas frederiksbergensis TaxID=104087 RepID=UPI000958B816|nr:DDE-type integrase/transposase/recombinase [Pseudomonas frederiksbergensis]APV39864.1 integrase [Pseudomonas frederiksbergensis]
MQTFSLKLQLSIAINGNPMTLHRRLIDRRLLFVDQYGEYLKLTESEFYLGYENQEIEISAEQPYLGEIPYFRNVQADLTCFPVLHADEAMRRRKYLDCLVEANGKKLPSREVIAEAVKKVALELGEPRTPSVSTVRRWFARYIGNDVIRLVPKHNKKGRKSLLVNELEELLQDVINTEYLKLERPPVIKVVSEFHDRIDAINAQRLPSQRMRKPCEMTIRRYVDKLDPYEVDVARLGKHAANKKHRIAMGELMVSRILDRWEIDHTLLDVLLTDPETGLVIGRPYLTVVLDRCSRMIMSFLLHFSAPNTESVLRVIERAIRPKAAWVARFPKVKSEWRAHGMPLRIVPDNAAEFHADDVISGFNELGIEIMYPRSRGPEMKGAVERFFGTLNTGLIHQIPGTTFSNVQQRGDYPSEANACLTLPDLEEKLVRWIVDIYHQRPHRGLSNSTPALIWLAKEARRQVRLPTDLDSLECVLARRKSVNVHHYGIELAGHMYHSPELAELRLRLKPGEKIQARYRDELGHIWVHDQMRNVFIQVSAKDKRLIGMSRDLYVAAKKNLRESGNTQPDFDAIHQAYRDIMTDIEGARHSHKLRKRRAAAKARLDKEGRSANVSFVPSVDSQLSWLKLFDDAPAVAGFAVSNRVSRKENGHDPRS